MIVCIIHGGKDNIWYWPMNDGMIWVSLSHCGLCECIDVSHGRCMYREPQAVVIGKWFSLAVSLCVWLSQCIVQWGTLVCWLVVSGLLFCLWFFHFVFWSFIHFETLEALLVRIRVSNYLISLSSHSRSVSVSLSLSLPSCWILYIKGNLHGSD